MIAFNVFPKVILYKNNFPLTYMPIIRSFPQRTYYILHVKLLHLICLQNLCDNIINQLVNFICHLPNKHIYMSFIFSSLFILLKLVIISLINKCISLYHLLLTICIHLSFILLLMTNYHQVGQWNSIISVG